LLNLTDVIET